METRVQKYKNYRGSLVKEGSKNYSTESKLFTTNTLPLDEVMTAANKVDGDQLVLLKRKEFKIKMAVLIVLALAIVVGIIVFACYAFKG